MAAQIRWVAKKNGSLWEFSSAPFLQLQILAVNTAITILRVNQIIMAKRAGGPKAPSQRGGHWDDDHDEED